MNQSKVLKEPSRTATVMERPADASRKPVWFRLRRVRRRQHREIQITLDSPMQGHGRSGCVALQVDDADAYYREWSAKVDVLRAPKDEEWSARTFDLLDPSGNTISVMGPVNGANQG